jgi:PAS domain S-box-containing protein
MIQGEKKKTILLVEDESTIAMAQTMTLQNYGYQVIVASTGEIAVQTANNIPNIDLILMDIDLGKGMNGPKTAKAILKTHDIPIVFLSSHTEPEVVALTETISSYGYVVKNAGITVLDASIKMAFKLFDAKRKIVENGLMLNAMIANISDVIVVVDPNCSLKYASSNIENYFGWRLQEISEGSCWTFVHPDDLERVQADFISLLQQDRNRKSLQFRMQCKSGEFKWIGLTGVNLVNDSIIGGVLLNFSDISERKRNEQHIKNLLSEKELILKEVHHRIKNNLSTVYSLLHFQAENMQQPEASSALKDAAMRVQSMLLLYQKLFQIDRFSDVSMKAYLPPLVDEIVANFPDHTTISIEKNVEDFILDSRTVQPLGIIINELLTNIMKYAFVGRTHGKIIVSAALTENRVVLSLEDDGLGLPESIDFEHSTGFGLMLIGILVKQLAGSIRIDRGHGTKVVLEFEP